MKKLFLLLAPLVCSAAIAQGANGLIVQLRDAPTHEQRAREQALARRDDSRWQQVLDAAGVRVTASRPSGAGARLLQFGQSRLTREQALALAERLQRRPEVAWVVPNERERRLQIPNDPLFTDQWWLHPVSGSDGNVIGQRLRGVPGFQRGWQHNTGAAGARVAVLDTGITTHPELAGRVVGGHDFVSDLAVANDGNGRDTDPSDPGDWVNAADAATPDFDGCTVEDSSWHGTLIAGIVAARTNEGEGVAGANWDGRIVPVRVAGKCGADVADIVDGMRWAAGLPVAGAPPNPNPARIVNLSFGGTGSCDPYQPTINELLAHGVVVVAAAGNERTTPTRPAKCPGVIGVAAVNRDGFKTNYSNFGPTLAIATVGGDDRQGLWGDLFDDGGLLTIYNTGRTTPGASAHAYLFGTSFATPVVAGALSLMLSVNPALSADQLRAGLTLTARPHVTSPHIGVCSSVNPWRCLCTSTTCGAGLLDVEQALLYAAAPTAYVAPAWTPAVLNNTETATAAARGADSGSSPPPPPPAGGAGGSGGGAMQPGWLLALALASLLLWRSRRG